MRSLVFIIFILSIDYYGYQAFRSLMVDWARTPRFIFTVFYFGITLAILFFMIGKGRSWLYLWPKPAQIYLSAFAVILLFSKAFVALFMFIDDLRRLFFWLLTFVSSEQIFDLARSQVVAKIGVVMGVVPFVTLTYGILRNKYRFTVHKSDIPVLGLPSSLNGFRIVQISDIHSGNFTNRESIRNGIKMINDLRADIVVFTGDLVNTVADEMDPYVDLFSEIRSKYGTYSILGNHDYGDYRAWPSAELKDQNFAKLKETHARMGWRLLLNATELVEIDGARVAIIGVENISAQSRFRTYGNLEKAHQGAHGADYKVLLSHDPSHWSAEVTRSFKDIGLTLSGHTHGFQFGIEIPGWIKWSPSKYVYKQWAGLYSNEDQHLYVNRGFGTLGYPGRVGILPEITLLQLKSV